MVKKRINEKELHLKSNIFYARTYRHLKINYKSMIIYYFLYAIPVIIVYLFSYSRITYAISKWTLNILYAFISRREIDILSGKFLPYFGDVYYLKLPSNMPSFTLIIINLVITFFLVILCLHMKDSAKPIAVYLISALLIHLSSCIFFLVAHNYFPYTLVNYSELYMKQQVGIWLSFIVIAVLTSGSISHSGISKYIMLFSVIAYSFIFGCLRYVIFLVILMKATLLYMPILFFSFGPFFDFLYLVCIYSIHINRLTIKFDDKKRGEEWYWA